MESHLDDAIKVLRNLSSVNSDHEEKLDYEALSKQVQNALLLLNRTAVQNSKENDQYNRTDNDDKNDGRRKGKTNKRKKPDRNETR